jgi:putative FmdB family regulatory protein
MPLFEYACRSCDREFETLVRASETPECPECGGTDLERRLSVFAAHTNSGGGADAMPTSRACGRCGDPRGPGACALN